METRLNYEIRTLHHSKVFIQNITGNSHYSMNESKRKFLKLSDYQFIFYIGPHALKLDRRYSKKINSEKFFSYSTV